jgi:anti-sigma factor RsiW
MPSSIAAFVEVEAPDLTHSEIQEWLGRAVDDGLGPDTQQQVDRHLGSCYECQVYAKSLRATVEAVRELPKEQLPETARQRLLSLFDQGD